jgi:hypothetical protein
MKRRGPPADPLFVDSLLAVSVTDVFRIIPSLRPRPRHGKDPHGTPVSISCLHPFGGGGKALNGWRAAVIISAPAWQTGPDPASPRNPSASENLC